MVALKADFDTEMFWGDILIRFGVFSLIEKSFPLYRSGVLNLCPTATLRQTALTISVQNWHKLFSFHIA
jgi:hypothetical protein